jgi:hypothetical protein
VRGHSVNAFRTVVGESPVVVRGGK